MANIQKNEIKKMVCKRLDAELKPLGWKVYKSGYFPVYSLDIGYFKISFAVCSIAGKALRVSWFA